MNLRTLGEFGLIGRIAARVGEATGVRCGIGDDAAALEFQHGHLQLLTSDMMLEGVHFDLTYTPPELLGRKALAVNLSDIAAMGGRPRWFLLSLGLPAALPLEFLDPFITGMLGLAVEHDVTLVGGDTCASRGGLVISITLVGEQRPAQVVYRRGATPGDLICVTGTLGDAALGLAELQAGQQSGPAITRHLDPSPRCREGLHLAEAGLPTAMIDVSDGLLADLEHILELSGVGGRVELAQIPLSPYYRQQVATISADPHQLALSGGEDYELLFTLPPARRAEGERLLAALGTYMTVVGEITAAGGLQVIADDGSPYQAVDKGFKHF